MTERIQIVNAVKICAQPGCPQTVRSRGYCMTHYLYKRRAGELELVRPAPTRHAKHADPVYVAEQSSVKRVEVARQRVVVVSTNPGDDRIRWIQANLRTAETGEPVVLQPFQQDFIRNAFKAHPDGERVHNTAVLSCGRKNGKTSLGAFLSICELYGPWAGSFTIPIASTARDAAGVLYDQAVKIARNSNILAEQGNRLTKLRKIETVKHLVNQETGGKLVSLSSDANTTIAMIPGGLIFVDELGWHKKRALFDSMDTSRGALNPLMIVIGTLGPLGSILNNLVDSHVQHPTPTRYVKVYSAPLGSDPFDQWNWRLANPGLGTILREKVVIDAFEEARYDKAKLAALKHLQLNMPASPGIEEFIGADAWMLGASEAPAEGPCWAGLDLSQTTDLTALALYWPQTGRIDFRIYTVKTPPLDERAGTDNIPYLDLPPGQLHVVGNRIIDYHEVAADLKMLSEQYDVRQIAADPWKLKALTETLEEGGVHPGRGGFPPIVTVKQDIAGLSGAIDEMDRRLRTGQIKHNNSVLFQRSLSAAKVYTDGNLNRKFIKSKSFGRIDPVVAAAMAIGAGHDRLTLASKTDMRGEALRRQFEERATESQAGKEFDPADYYVRPGETVVKTSDSESPDDEFNPEDYYVQS